MKRGCEDDMGWWEDGCPVRGWGKLVGGDADRDIEGSEGDVTRKLNRYINCCLIILYQNKQLSLNNRRPLYRRTYGNVLKALLI